MSRRIRKIAANKKYNNLLKNKASEIAKVSINGAIMASKAIANNNIIDLLAVAVSTKEQIIMIASQPLFMTKPDKYGKYKDYALGGVVVGVNQ